MDGADAGVTYRFRARDCVIGAQMLFVAFGALVLVPMLTGLNANVALFTAGVGTLIFQICTRGKVPIFLGSSFAFIAPISYGAQTWGLPATMGGLVCVGGVYVLFSFLIRFKGTGILLKLLPPIVTGPVIMVIGLILAPSGVNMALGKTGDGSAVLVPEETALIISMTALLVTILVSLLGKGFIRLVPIICGITAGFLCSLAFGVYDFSKVAAAPWFAMPPFFSPNSGLNPSSSFCPSPSPRSSNISATCWPSAPWRAKTSCVIPASRTPCSGTASPLPSPVCSAAPRTPRIPRSPARWP